MSAATIDHSKDSDCTVAEGVCTECGVGHDSDACQTCGGAAYHVEGCPETDGGWYLGTHAMSQFPVRCGACGASYADPAEYATKTTPPSGGRSIATLDGVADTWQRNCPCTGTMCIELQEEV